jgi:hypothetical protein
MPPLIYIYVSPLQFPTYAPLCPADQIAGVSRRLLELHALLGGGGDVDVIWMVTREPQLLTASRHQLMSRLMAMRVRAWGGAGGGGEGE